MSTIPQHPLPSVHLNGTGGKTLLDGYRAFYEAMLKAGEALAEIEFNARDYYVQDDQAFTKARAARDAVAQNIREISNYALNHAIHVKDAMKK